jgi:hypothetical protein
MSGVFGLLEMEHEAFESVKALSRDGRLRDKVLEVKDIQGRVGCMTVTQ